MQYVLVTTGFVDRNALRPSKPVVTGLSPISNLKMGRVLAPESASLNHSLPLDAKDSVPSQRLGLSLVPTRYKQGFITKKQTTLRSV